MLIFSAFPLNSALADTAVPAYKEGAYQIGTKNELIWFRDEVNKGGTSADLSAKLTSDIDLNNMHWTPIGTNGFTGSFDGGRHTIRNYIITSADLTDMPRVGLFSWMWKSAVIENLTVDGSISIELDSHGQGIDAGGIVGFTTGSVKILNCTNKGNIKISVLGANPNSGITNTAGGIVGKVLGNTEIACCVNKGSITASEGDRNHSGGIAGSKDGDNIVTNCINFGNVAATGRANYYGHTSDNYAGGIAGSHSNHGRISNCVNSGSSQITADGCASNYAGGIVGQNSVWSPVIINCANESSGKIAALNGNNAYAGGLVGSNEWESIIDGCVNAGSSEISVSGSGNMACAGGIAGDNSELAEIINSAGFGEGKISAEGGRTRGAGGITGYCYGDNTISNCAWNKNLSDVSVGYDLGTTSADAVAFSKEDANKLIVVCTLKNITVSPNNTLEALSFYPGTAENASKYIRVTSADISNTDIAKIKHDAATIKISGIKDGIAAIRAVVQMYPVDFKKMAPIIDNPKELSLASIITVSSIPVTGIVISEKSTSLKIGESKTLTATVEPNDATNQSIIWSSSNEKVVTVDENGKITAVAEGTATITVMTEDGSFSAECQVDVAAGGSSSGCASGVGALALLALIPLMLKRKN